MSVLKTLLLYAAATLGTGGLAALAAGGFGSYETLVLPAFAPPGWLFPVVWTVLYLLLAVSAAMVALSHSPERNRALTAFWVGLAANFLWPLLFFRLKLYWISFSWCLVLVILVAWMAGRFGEIKKKAGLLQIPYLVWLLYATAINLAAALMN